MKESIPSSRWSPGSALAVAYLGIVAFAAIIAIASDAEGRGAGLVVLILPWILVLAVLLGTAQVEQLSPYVGYLLFALCALLNAACIAQLPRLWCFVTRKLLKESHDHPSKGVA
jgi:hypothetical protein